MRYIDPNGMSEKDKEENNIIQKAIAFIGQLANLGNGAENDMENPVMYSDEIKGINKTTKIIKEIEKEVVDGMEKVHDAAEVTSGASAIYALSTTGSPISLGAGLISQGSGIIAAGASGAKWAITGEQNDRDRFLFEAFTIGVGTAAKAIRSGKTLTSENAGLLQEVIQNFVSGASWGIGFGIK